jgi:homoserine O-acetyltransferase
MKTVLQCLLAAWVFLMAPKLWAIEPPAWSARATEAIWVAPEFRFSTGEVLKSVKFLYHTLGTPRRDSSGRIINAVLLLHGTTNVGAEFLLPSLASQLFGAGQPLDAAEYYVIMPDGLGRGGSTKPSDGLKGHFPRYGYSDLVAGQYRLVTEALGVEHLRLVLGVSMGGMNAWQWAEAYPDMMDAVMPIACTPARVSGRNLLIRRVVTESIRHDPDWRGGDYQDQPPGFIYTFPLFTAFTQGLATLQAEAPDFAAGQTFFGQLVQRVRTTLDANDILYGLEASYDYDPEPDLGKIKAQVMAVNFADDALNPVELGTLARLVARVANAKAVVVPVAPISNGHFSLLQGSLWRPHLESLLAALPPM